MLEPRCFLAMSALAVISTLILSPVAAHPPGQADRWCEDSGEGRRYIDEPIVIGPGDEGMYTVTRDISSEDEVIRVLPGARSVEIDLNGFTLDSEYTPVRVDGAAVFKIRNGNLQGGVSIRSTRQVVIEDLTISPAEGAGVSLRDVGKFAVRRNLIRQGEPAMTIDNTTGGVIEDNVLDGGDAAMILKDLKNVEVARNRVDRPGDTDGIDVRGCVGCRFVDNLVHRVYSSGMSLVGVTGSLISGNVVSGESECSYGVKLSDTSNYNMVLENTVTDCNDAGILVAGVGNVIDRNLLSANRNWGLLLTGTGNVYKGNVANGNLGVAADCPGTGPATTDLCDATSGGNRSRLDNLMPDTQ